MRLSAVRKETGRQGNKGNPQTFCESRIISKNTRLGIILPRRDAYIIYNNPRRAFGCPAYRRNGNSRKKKIHAPLQLPAFLGRRNQTDEGPSKKRYRTRRFGRACSLGDHPEAGRFSVHDSRGFRNTFVKWIILDGLGYSWRLVPDGRGSADQSPGRGNRDGIDVERSEIRLRRNG